MVMAEVSKLGEKNARRQVKRLAKKNKDVHIISQEGYWFLFSLVSDGRLKAGHWHKIEEVRRDFRFFLTKSYTRLRFAIIETEEGKCALCESIVPKRFSVSEWLSQ